MMTPKQVFNAQMHFKTADRCFFMEIGFFEVMHGGQRIGVHASSRWAFAWCVNSSTVDGENPR